MVVTRPSQPRRANAPVFYPQYRPSGGSGGWYSPLALRMRDPLRGRLSILMPILVTATMPAMAMTRTAATTATAIQSTPLVCAGWRVRKRVRKRFCGRDRCEGRSQFE